MIDSIRLFYCERSRAKRGELAERSLDSRMRESSCTGIQANKTIEYLENKAFLTYGVQNKKCLFSPPKPISGLNRPDPAAQLHKEELFTVDCHQTPELGCHHKAAQRSRHLEQASKTRFIGSRAVGQSGVLEAPFAAKIIVVVLQVSDTFALAVVELSLQASCPIANRR